MYCLIVSQHYKNTTASPPSRYAEMTFNSLSLSFDNSYRCTAKSNSRAVHKHSIQTGRQFATNFSDLKEQAEVILTLETHLDDSADMYLPIAVRVGAVELFLVVTMIDHKGRQRSSNNENNVPLQKDNHYPSDRGHELAHVEVRSASLGRRPAS